VGGTERVLVVEDEPFVRLVAVRSLARAGYRVCEAPDAATALAEVERDGHPDLLLTDVAMPGMNGFDLVRRLCDASPGQRVLLMSGYVEPGAVAFKGFDPTRDIIQKPFAPAELLRRVRAVLDRRAT
jgi:two-component system cell cycle sensor histidine kinase/response regulator CckA